MRASAHRFTIGFVASLVGMALLLAPSAGAEPAARKGPAVDFTTPLFGMDAGVKRVFVADAGSGIVRVKGNARRLVVPLPGVADVALVKGKSMLAVTGAPDSMLYRIRDYVAEPLADLGAYEAKVNPDGGEVDSNPFAVAKLPGGRALVADAGGNSVLIVERDGTINWVATLPHRMTSTKHAKELAGCPEPADPEFDFVCELPARIPAEGVATSVAVGPVGLDNAWYVGELRGFPATPGTSRIWRIEPGTRRANCGESPRCTVFADGFTSIVDLDLARDRSLHVVEFDEASWLAVEIGQATKGSIDACNLRTGRCPRVTRLVMPSAVASTRTRTFATVMSLVAGQADVVRIG
jgi:hypothetical protein